MDYAFPLAHDIQPESPGARTILVDKGMTLRDYFAGQALANLNLQAHIAKPAAEALAASAYEIADSMLKARDT